VAIRSYRTLRDGLRADVGRAIAMATGGVLTFAPIEYALTVWAYSGSTSALSKLRLIALTATLSSILWLVIAVTTAAMVVAVRVVRARIDPAAATTPGLFEHAPLVDGVRPGVPRLWAGLFGVLVLGAAIQRATAWATVRFKEPQLTALTIAALAVTAMLVMIPLHRGFAIAARVGARSLVGVGPFNPLGRWRPAGVAIATMILGAVAVTWVSLPQSRSVIPVRLILSGCVIAIGMGLGARAHERATPSPRARRDALRLAGGALVFNVLTLVWIGADLETKYAAVTASPALDKLIELVRDANDLDGDGFGSLLGEADCAPFSSSIHPGALDLPGDGIDQDCDGEDTTYADLVAPTGPVVPVPDKFLKPWNVLLITIDATRYDHTSFGGYKQKGRDTTPRLAELVSQSTSFTYANAPAPGTMASIPAIMTSKFFHSGVAMDDDAPRPHGYPPKLLPENVMFAEIMKGGGYYTGAIGSHEWWTNWGLDQGFDDFDNSIGRIVDPYRVVADQITDHALAFISRNQNRKWFLWAHYIDPHGRYVAHPDVVDYGTADMDLYDGELRWTDQEIGRLLDELKRLPSYRNTIIVVTSDHGESMGEHGVPTGTHGTALYRELTHVPLIFFIPDLQPKQVGGAVTPLDILPTVTALVGIDTSKLEFEGRSLVGALFYGRADHDRIVFSETNAPNKRRAAISEHFRLLYYLSNNIYELFDHQRDPEELDNLAPKSPPALDTMKKALGAWMNRVMYARDPTFNQAFRLYMSDVILDAPPTPTVPCTGQTFDDGKIEILGIGLDPTTPAAPNLRPEFHVYFHVNERTKMSYRFQLVGWPVEPGVPLTDPMPISALRSNFRVTAGGAYPTTQWRANEYIRERFPLQLPATWKAKAIAIGLVISPVANHNQKLRATGAAPSNDGFTFSLGQLPVMVP